ncbi:MAG: hypothetical protein JXN62_04560, partial [Bacteroidales bacterium]|nr:hypothetical protein [Bacteroidales bacterium]
MTGVNYETVYNYEADGTLKQAGDIVLTNDNNTGILKGTTLSNVSSVMGYNQYGELNHDTYYYGGVDIADFDYSGDDVERDGLGRIISKTEKVDEEESVTYNYFYDDADRLVDVYVYKGSSANAYQWYEYEYDDNLIPAGNGNRTAFRLHTDENENGVFDADEVQDERIGTYDAQDRIVQYGEDTYSYTDGGMLESITNTDDGSETDYDYDLAGNLRGVSVYDGTPTPTKDITYTVDGFGRRIWKSVGGSRVQGFIYKDQLNPIAELDGDGNTVSVFIYGSKSNVPDYMMHYEVDQWVKYRIISDQVGSVRLVVNAETGAVAQKMTYSPFGEVLTDEITVSGFHQPFG